MEELRFCKKCLIRQMQEEEDLYQVIKAHLEQMEPDSKVPPQEYERRLKLCEACELLLTGMCRSCGCYVEIRAAKKNLCCPEGNW